MISNAHRSVLETEEVGMEITSELARNREKIESSRAKVALTVVLTLRMRNLILYRTLILGCGVFGHY